MLKLFPLYLRSLSPPPFRALGSTPEVSSGLEWIQRTFIVVSRGFMTPADDISPAGTGSCLDDTEDICGVMELHTHDRLHVILFQHERS